jgi:hypothetical protein
MKYDYLTVEEQEAIKVEYIKEIEESHLRNTLYVKELEGKLTASSGDSKQLEDYNRLKSEILEKISRQEEELTSLKKESGAETQK